VRIPASVERVDSMNDLAILTTAGELAASPLPLVEKTPTPGTTVYAIGNPLGLEKSISTGVVAGIREDKGRRMLQSTSPISPGSSGGPVLDASGNVIGVAVGTLEDGQNINFAVPATSVLDLLNKRAGGATSFTELIRQADELLEKRNILPWSYAPES